MRRAVALVLLVAASIPLWGCGATDADLNRKLASERGRTLWLLDPRDVAQQPAGSPGRALLELWRALQFRDPQLARELLTGLPRSRPATIEETILRLTGPSINARPRILATSRRGDRARLSVELALKKGIGSKGVKTVTTKLSLSFERSPAGRWQLVYEQNKFQKVLAKVAG